MADEGEQAGWHARAVDEVEEALDVRADGGLTDDEAARRREEHGDNRLDEAKQRGVVALLWDQVRSVVLLVLVVAGAVAFATGHVVEGVAVSAVVAINVAIGFTSEWRARRSMHALQELDQRVVRVRRGGHERELPATELVPGDVVLVDAGDLVGADLRVVEANRLSVSEAALTGESVPVGKATAAVEGEQLADRASMLFKGTTVVEGTGTGVVVATGMRTELGRIAGLTASAEDASTPLEKRLDALGARLAWVTLGVAALVGAAGLLAGQPTRLMIETAIALGVAAIPEGLPIVATIALARGMWRMARRHALVRRLTAVETLGATSVIFTDKTGTLTENNMTLRRVVTPGEGDDDDAHTIHADERDTADELPPLVRRALEIGALCTNASLEEGDDEGQGDPTEVGLLRGAAVYGIWREALLAERPEEREEPFDPEVMMMATFHRRDDGIRGWRSRRGVRMAMRGKRQRATRRVGTGGIGGWRSRRGVRMAMRGKRQRATRRVGTGGIGGWRSRRGVRMAMRGKRQRARRRVGTGGLEVAVKGAPGSLLDHCDRVATPDGGERAMDDALRERWRERTVELAGEGLRVLAVADRRADSVDAEPFEGLRFVGLVGLLDPPRADVRDAIASCHAAGVRVVMVTGDQVATARAIGRELGIGGDDATVVHGRDFAASGDMTEEQRQQILRADIFARMSPEQKLDLIGIHQDAGAIVAMTGDGVNDAPALKKADIGVAMGKRGTDAAREVSDMVLQDDAFASIVAAVQQGRVIFGNIRRSVMFMLCTNVAEVIAVAAASLAGIPVPLLPLQILFLNVMTDVFPALALGVGEGDPTVMERPPRPADEGVLTRKHWLAVGGWGVLIATVVVSALGIGLTALGMDDLTATTVSFLTLGFAKLWFVFNLRDPGTSPWRNDVVRNPWMWGAIGLCTTLLVAAVYLPGLSDVLKTRDIGATGWAVVAGMSLVPFAVGQVLLARGRAAVGRTSGAAEKRD